MLVGEIGIPWREYLYDLTFCDILLIKRGYFRRYHPEWEMARLIAHQVHYCMGVPPGKTAKEPSEWVPFPWERKSTKSEGDMPDKNERKRMQQMMREYNAKIEEESSKQK